MNPSRILLAAALAALVPSCGSSSGPDPVAPTVEPTGPAPADTGAQAPPAAPAPTPPELRLPDSATPLTYIVNLELDPTKPTFQGDVRINLELAAPTDHVWLHGTDLTVAKATVKTDREILDAAVIPDDEPHFLGLSFPKPLSGQVWLEIAYQGKVSDKDMHGLFRQEVEGNWYMYSQLESFSARAVYPSFDEPRWKVPFTVTLTVPSSLEAFSNAPAKQTIPAREGYKSVVFETTKPIPTYLTAFAVGPFEVVDVGQVGRNKTPVRMIALKGHTSRLEFAKQAVVEAQTRLEDYFDMAYPYPKLDHIAVPRFFGAMENPGLITYDEGLLRQPEGKSWAFERRSASVIAHEIAHQWFGDLVTLAWWDDVWLNESFATWMAAKVVDQWKPAWKGEVGMVAERAAVMDGDSMITARKIRQPIKSHDDIANAFDGITYGKGSAVLWMFEQMIGAEPFRDGVRAYMRKHEWGTATADDFLSAIAAVSDPSTPAAFKSFLDQPGVPIVSGELECHQKALPVVNLRQERYLPAGSKGSTAETWNVPVCVSVPGPGKKTTRVCKVMTGATERVMLRNGGGCPKYFNLNAGAAGYYRAGYTAPQLRSLLASKLTPAERITVIADLNAMVRADKLGVGDALSFLPGLMKEKNPYVAQSALKILGQLGDNTVPPELRPNLERFIRKTFGKRARQLGWLPKKGDDDETKRLRSRLLTLVAIRGNDRALQKQARKLADKWLSTGKGIDTEDVTEVLTAAAYNADAAFYDRLAAKLAELKEERPKESVLAAMGSFRDPALVERNIKTFLENDKLPLRASFALMAGGLTYDETRQLTYDLIKKNYPSIIEKLPKFVRGYVAGVAGAFCDQAHIDDAKAFFGPRSKKEMGGEKALAQTIEAMELCIAFKTAQGAKVEAFLKKY